MPRPRVVGEHTMDPTRPMPMAVLGHSLFLPQGIHGGEKLFELVRAKRQVAAHRDDTEYPPKMVMDPTGDGSSWKYRVEHGNYFKGEEVVDTDKKLFRIGEKEAQFMQAVQCWVLEAVFRAIEHAGLKLEQIQGTRTGVFVGGFSNQPQLRVAPNETSIRGSPMSSLADKVAFYLGTRGPCMTTETACSSSLIVLSQAVSFIRKGDCDTAIVVGSSVRCWADYLVQMQALGVMSPRGFSNPFDETADGMGRAEAYGCMIIRRMDLAEMQQDNILATLVNSCAGHAGPEDDVIEGSGRVYEAPCAAGINNIIRTCYEQAHVPMEHVRYIEAHATGTPVGDLIELEGISRALRDHHHAVYNPIRVASVKGNVGHAEMAAGMISLVKVMGMLKHRVFLPSGGLTKPRQDFDWASNAMMSMVDEEPFPEHEPVYIGVNSFGLGGAYGHAILTPYKPHTAYKPRPLPPLRSPSSLSALGEEDAYHLLPFSAASEAHLALYETALADYLESQCKSLSDTETLSMDGSSSSRSLSSPRRPVFPAQLLRDVCGTMWCHRSSMRYRRAYVASDVGSLVTQLRSESKESGVSVVDPAMSKKDAGNGIALVFTGQGAQWLGCGDRLVSRFPVYRRAVEAVDSIFLKVAGWSLRERVVGLSKEELMQTQYAQPFTFMVQVGLTELLKSFNLRTTVVVGHSAGEVSAAYAAGKLSLEQAVKLVYHRSQLQQRLAGSGRMLVVGLSASETAAVLDKAGSVAGDVHVACLNSPQNTVLAGTETNLLRVEALLPDGTFKAWVAGNIAFHCPLVEPILQDMRSQLSPFLPADPVQREAAPEGEAQELTTSQVMAMLASSGRERQEESDVTFISTVTGDEYEGPLSPAYWLRNVREAVQFQGAVETLLRLPDCPKYVIEVGPHKTLLAPLLQTAQAMGGDKGFATALSTLKRGEADDAMFMHMLAKLFEAGMHTLSLDRWFGRDEDYELLRDLPGHPMIKARLFQQNDRLIADAEEHKVTGFSCGPTAGQYVGLGKLQAAAEVSDANLPKMAEHVMGGMPILPGTFFVVAAIETLGGVPCTMTDVSMLNMCKIPQGLEERVTLTTQLEKEVTAPDDAYRFTVSTGPVADLTLENATVSCTGRVFRNPDILEALEKKVEEGEGEGEGKEELPPPSLDVHKYGMDKYCMQAQVDLQDIGKEGIESLTAMHPVAIAKDNKEVYQVLNIEGIRHWGPSFALAQSAHMSRDRMSLLAVVMSDCKGEYYTPQLLDCFVHLGILNPMADPNVIALNGGFERAHFLRVPGPGDVYVHVVFKPYLSMGRVKRVADIHAYDAEGRLIMWLEGSKIAFGGDKGTIRLAEMHWQPYASTVNAQEVQAAVKAVSEHEGPPKHCHDAMAELVSSVGLSKSGRVVGETPEGACVSVRVLLECNNDDCAALSQALLGALAAHVGLSKGDVIVEVYTILRKASLLAALDLKVASRAASWLRYRRVVLPLGWEQLGDLAFDVIITSHMLQGVSDGEEGKEQSDTASKLDENLREEDRVDDTLTSLLTHACPGGVVLVHVHEPAKVEEEDKSDIQADTTTPTPTEADAEAGALTPSRNADFKQETKEAEKMRKEAEEKGAKKAAEERKTAGREPSGEGPKSPKTTGTDSKGKDEEAEEQTAPMPVLLVLSPALRTACFERGEEVMTVGGRDGTLFVGRAPTPPIIRTPVVDKTQQQPPQPSEEAGVEQDADQSVSQAQEGGEAPVARREVLLVAESSVLAKQVKEQLLSSSPQAVDAVRVLLCGPGSGFPLLDEKDEERQQASEKTVVKAWMDALREQVGPLACREIIFLAGMTDESPVGSVGFYRLLRLAKAIAKLQTPPQPEKEAAQEEGSDATVDKPEDEEKKEEGAEAEKETETKEEEEEEPDVPGMEGSEEFEGPKALWVVTKGCFSKRGVVIGQASLYAAARNLEVEVDDLAVRVADLADLDCLPRLASLVASQPRERFFRVESSGDVLVQRFFVHTLGKTMNTVSLSADDSHMAFGICLPYEDEYPIPGKVTVETRAWPIPPPGDDEVTVRVHSAGVNFRDALMAMSLMPTESFENSFRGKCLGMEAAGTVVAVGKNVKDLEPNERVWTSGTDSFCSMFNAPKILTYALPDGASFAQAATAQVAYVTAHRGLVDMARLKKGDTVLVHAAAGGVGMAAVSVCKAYGAEVYATASAAKRELVEKWGVDPSRIFDSRSYSWFEDVMRATEGQGVDIVFNSLAGKHQKLGMEALRTGGRFCEIGKIDVYRNAAIGLMAMARNCQFIMVDIDELGKASLKTCAAGLQQGVGKVASGEYKALPFTSYAMGDAQEAMDLMKTGKHTGKLLLTNYETEADMAQPRCTQARLDHTKCLYKSEGVYLVTGGGGGFGSRIVRHAVMLGARTFVVTLTRDAESRVQALFGDLLQQHSDLAIHAVTANLSVKDDVARVVAVCRSLDQPLRSIIHCAGNSFDKTLHQIKRGDLESLSGPKNMGAWWLHEMTLDMTSIEDFAVISSAAADLAARGFLVYGPTNAMLNSFVRYRQSLGLPACALNMATLCDVGIVADKPAVRQMQVAMGLEMLTSARACRDLAEVMMSGRQLLQLQLKHAGWSALAPTFCHNVPTTVTLGAQEEGERRLAPEEALDFILQTVRDITKSDNVMPGDTLASVSIDSLSLMDLTSRIKRVTGVELPMGKLKATSSIADVAEMVAQRMRAMQGMTEAVASAVEESTEAANWVQRRVKEEVEKEAKRAKRRSEAASQPAFSMFEDDPQAAALRAREQEQEDVSRCMPLKFWRGKADKRQRGRRSTEEDSITTTSTSSTHTEETEEMTPLKARQWFKISFPNKDAKSRLLVIPAAGRGTQQYSMWMLPGVEIVAVQIPGKEGREEEAPSTNLVEWGAKIARAAVFAGLLDDNKPVSVLGHSSGSILALETCRALQKHYNYTAQHLFVCSLQAPHLMSDLPGPLKKFFYKFCLNKRSVQTLIWAAGGLSRPVFLDKRSQQFIDGLWKQGDAVKEYSETHMLPLPAEDVLACPITVMWGEHDIVSNPKFGKRWWRDWDAYSHEKVRVMSFAGHHFFPFQPKLTPHVLQAINDTILPAEEGRKVEREMAQ